MNKITTSTAIPTRALKLEALSNIVASFESFCLASGLEALREMMDHDVQAICGPRHARGRERQAHRWGKPTARSPSMEARWTSSGRGCGASTERSIPCRAGRLRVPKTGSANGQGARQSRVVRAKPFCASTLTVFLSVAFTLRVCNKNKDVSQIRRKRLARFL